MGKWVVLFMLLAATGCATPAKKYLKQHPEIEGDRREAIAREAVSHGLTKADVIASVGEPKKSFGYEIGDRVRELWLYSDFYWYRLENILFEDGKVIGWNLPTQALKKEFDLQGIDSVLAEQMAEHAQ